MRKFPNKKQRRAYYQKEGQANYQQHLYGNPSDWIHHRIKDLSFFFLKQILKKKKPARVLDIGCAEGLYLRSIGRLIKKGIGLDISARKIKRARDSSKRLKNLRFLSSDFLDYQIARNSFDMIFSIETLEHIPHIEKILKKIYSSLKTKGFFVVSIPTDKEMIFYHQKGSWQKESGHLYNWSKQEFSQLLRKQGFNIIKVRGINNVLTQIISALVRLIIGLFKSPKLSKKTSRKNKEKIIKTRKALTKGARVFYLLDEFFTSTPVLNQFNNYNMFICQKN